MPRLPPVTIATFPLSSRSMRFPAVLLQVEGDSRNTDAPVSIVKAASVVGAFVALPSGHRFLGDGCLR
jgi:hypothetical protein